MSIRVKYPKELICSKCGHRMQPLTGGIAVCINCGHKKTVSPKELKDNKTNE